MSWMVSCQPHFKRQPEGQDGDLGSGLIARR
ncbi:hypothetical protein [Gluconobacter sp. GP1]